MGKKAKVKSDFIRQVITVGVWLLGKKYRVPVELFDLINSCKDENEALNKLKEYGINR